MSIIYRSTVLVFGLLLAVSPAQSAEGDVTKSETGEIGSITVTDSLKDSEILMAKILKEKLNVKGTLGIRGDNAEDLLLKVRFDGSDEKNVPTINAVIDTRTISRDGNGNAVSQVITISSFANIDLLPDTDLQRLEWVNKWNRRSVPLFTYVVRDRMVVTQKLLITKDEPMTPGQFSQNFASAIRYWPTLVNDLRDSGLVE